jgi:hypothetical protein
MNLNRNYGLILNFFVFFLIESNCINSIKEEVVYILGESLSNL